MTNTGVLAAQSAPEQRTLLDNVGDMSNIAHGSLSLTTSDVHMVDKVKRAPHTAGYCDPAVVGLTAYAITAALFQVKNFGLCGGGPAATAGIFFGGITQLIAGLQCYQVGNHFGYCAFCTYGAMWLALPWLGMVRTLEIIPVGDNDYAAFLFMFGLYTLMMTVASMWHHLALFTTIFFLFGGFFWLTVYFWLRNCGATVGLHWKYSGRNASAVEICESEGHHHYVWAEYIAAVSITISCAVAMYIVLVILLKETGVHLPLGPKPIDELCRLLRPKAAARSLQAARSDSVALASTSHLSG